MWYYEWIFIILSFEVESFQHCCVWNVQVLKFIILSFLWDIYKLFSFSSLRWDDMYLILPENPYFPTPCPSEGLMCQIHSVYNKISCVPWCSLSFCSAKLGLISSEESAKSSVTDDDARKFLHYEEPVEQGVAEEEVMDADDLVWNISTYCTYQSTVHTFFFLKFLHEKTRCAWFQGFSMGAHNATPVNTKEGGNFICSSYIVPTYKRLIAGFESLWVYIEWILVKYHKGIQLVSQVNCCLSLIAWGPMTCSFQDFYMFWNGVSSISRGSDFRPYFTLMRQ
jgi:hypothetical protein